MCRTSRVELPADEQTVRQDLTLDVGVDGSGSGGSGSGGDGTKTPPNRMSYSNRLSTLTSSLFAASRSWFDSKKEISIKMKKYQRTFVSKKHRRRKVYKKKDEDSRSSVDFLKVCGEIEVFNNEQIQALKEQKTIIEGSRKAGFYVHPQMDIDIAREEENRSKWDLIMSLLLDANISCIINEFLHYYEYFSVYEKSYICEDEIVVMTDNFEGASRQETQKRLRRHFYSDFAIEDCRNFCRILMINLAFPQDIDYEKFNSLKSYSKVYILHRNDTKRPLHIHGLSKRKN
eukprot:UN24621